jgi:HEAT repeat protein
MGLPSFAHFGSGPQFQESFEQCNFTKVLLEFLWQTHGVSIFTSGATNSIANIRKLCAYALGDLAVPEGTEPLVKLIQDSNEAVGKAAWFALSESQDPRVPSLLIEALEKGDSKTKSRVASCFAMPMRRDAQAVDALLIQLQGNDSVVSCSCALALSSIRDARAIDALIEAMEKPKVRRAAHMALQSITGKDLGDDPFEWKKWRQK